jgi:hypothetical protein
MPDDLKFYLDKVPQEVRILADLMLRQNQSDKREVSALISEQSRSHREQAEVLEKILLQTQKTNGRVNKLEKWQTFVIGFCTCLTVLVLPIAFFIIKEFLLN